MNISVTPRYLQYVTSVSTGGECYSAMFSQSGDKLFVSCENEMRLYIDTFDEVEGLLDIKSVTSIAKSAGDTVEYFFVKHSDEDEAVRVVGRTSDFTSWELQL